MFQQPQGDVKGEEKGGRGERLVNYGTDAQQHLGVNALGQELSSHSPPGIYSQTLGHPAGAGLVWVLPQ